MLSLGGHLREVFTFKSLNQNFDSLSIWLPHVLNVLFMSKSIQGKLVNFSLRNLRLSLKQPRNRIMLQQLII